MKRLIFLLTLTTLICAKNISELKELKSGTVVSLQGMVQEKRATNWSLIEDSTGEAVLRFPYKKITQETPLQIIGIYKGILKEKVQIKPLYLKQGDSYLIPYEDSLTLPAIYEQNLQNRVVYNRYRDDFSSAIRRLSFGGSAILAASLLLHQEKSSDSAPLDDNQRSLSTVGRADLNLGFGRAITISLIYTGGTYFTLSGLVKLSRAITLKRNLRVERETAFDLQFNPLKKEIALIGEF